MQGESLGEKHPKQALGPDLLYYTRHKILSVRVHRNAVCFKSNQTFDYNCCITLKRVSRIRGPSSVDCAEGNTAP